MRKKIVIGFGPPVKEISTNWEIFSEGSLRWLGSYGIQQVKWGLLSLFA